MLGIANLKFTKTNKPPPKWVNDPMKVAQSFEQKHKPSPLTAYLMWAVWSVDGLYYLCELDESFKCYGHSTYSVDIAHVRWATASAITALDLCAAGLGHQYCGPIGGHELTLKSFTPGKKGAAKHIEMLPPQVADWVREVSQDHRYQLTLAARHPMVHGRMARHFQIGTIDGVSFLGRANRTAFSIPVEKLVPELDEDDWDNISEEDRKKVMEDILAAQPHPAPKIVSTATEMAKDHVQRFLLLVDNL